MKRYFEGHQEKMKTLVLKVKSNSGLLNWVKVKVDGSKAVVTSGRTGRRPRRNTRRCWRK